MTPYLVSLLLFASPTADGGTLHPRPAHRPVTKPSPEAANRALSSKEESVPTHHEPKRPPELSVWQQCDAGCGLGEGPDRSKKWQACMRKCQCEHQTKEYKDEYCKPKKRATKK